jgi:hypothetical protein
MRSQHDGISVSLSEKINTHCTKERDFQHPQASQKRPGIGDVLMEVRGNLLRISRLIFTLVEMSMRKRMFLKCFGAKKRILGALFVLEM